MEHRNNTVDERERFQVIAVQMYRTKQTMDNYMIDDS